MLAIGTRVGEYEIERALGAGGMAEVYQARHAVLHTRHAIKVLLPALRESEHVRQRFLDEARVQANHLNHPNIVKVTGIVATADHAALVIELVEGTTLEDELAALRSRPDEMIAIMLGVLEAVGHAHALGVIHRDLKPANVLLARKNGVLVPKVTDFGIAKIAADIDGGKSKSTHAEAKMGTLHYMSPEQIRSAKNVTPQSDIFSLGAMFFEMATGKVAFDGTSDYEVMDAIVHGRYAKATLHASVAPRVAKVIEKAMAPDPADRYPSCEAMAIALRNAHDDVGALLAESSPSRRSLALAFVAIAVSVAVIVGGVFMVKRKHGAQKPAAAASAPARDAGVATAADAAAVVTTPIDAAVIATPTPARPAPAPRPVAPPPPKNTTTTVQRTDPNAPIDPFAAPHPTPRPKPKDTDGDGIPDVVDKCPSEKETRNGYQDSDGCADLRDDELSPVDL